MTIDAVIPTDENKDKDREWKSDKKTNCIFQG